MKNETVEKKATENTAKNKMKKFDIAALQKAYTKEGQVGELIGDKIKKAIEND